MKLNFGVFIGNSPYQLGTNENGMQARSIYYLFIERVKNESKNSLMMILPSRWFSGGIGLEKFRNNMLKDDRIIFIHDF